MGEKPKNKDAENAKGKNEDLKEGLEESFPASDPPAATQPGSGAPDEKKAPKK